MTASAMSSGRPMRRMAMRSANCAPELLAVGVPLPLVVGAGRHEARRHRVDRDAERPQFLGELLHQPDLAVLGRGIGLDAGQAGGEAGAARDGDDAPAAACFHARRDGAGEQEAALQVGVDDAGELLRAAPLRAAWDAGRARRPRHRPARRPGRPPARRRASMLAGIGDVDWQRPDALARSRSRAASRSQASTSAPSCGEGRGRSPGRCRARHRPRSRGLPSKRISIDQR